MSTMSTHDSIPIVDDGGAFYGVPQPNINAGIPRGGQTFIPQIPVPQPGNQFQPAYGQPAPFMPAGPQPTMQQPQLLQNIQEIASNPIAQYGIGQASTMLRRVDVGFVRGYVQMLKYYFTVNNAYVANKLKIILFPFIHKKWSRTIQREADGDSYPPPADDLNAPDLYIPSMAFITYILIVAFFMGAQYQFTPQVLGRTASSGITIVSFEVLLLKLLFYLLSFPSPPLLDLVSYCGYKFVWTTIIIFAGLFGSGAFWIAYGIHVILMGSFMVKTLRVVIRNPSDSGNSSNRKYLLLFIALMQAIITLFLCYLDFKYQPASVVNGAGNNMPLQTQQQQQQQTLPEVNNAGGEAQ